MSRWPTVALAAAAVILAGCSSGAAAHKAASSPAAAAASSPAAADGCSQALLVAGTVRSGLEGSTLTPGSALKRISSTAKQIPEGNLRVDMDAAAFYLAQWNLAAATGHGGGQWAHRFASSLVKISTDCQNG